MIRSKTDLWIDKKGDPIRRNPWVTPQKHTASQLLGTGNGSAWEGRSALVNILNNTNLWMMLGKLYSQLRGRLSIHMGICTEYVGNMGTPSSESLPPTHWIVIQTIGQFFSSFGHSGLCIWGREGGGRFSLKENGLVLVKQCHKPAVFDCLYHT